jgi:hypothetical protein
MALLYSNQVIFTTHVAVQVILMTNVLAGGGAVVHSPIPPQPVRDLTKLTSTLPSRLLGKVDRAKDARKRTKDVRDTKTKE